MATCSRCGARAAGNFCSSCGTPLKAKPCPGCGAVTEVGARFCNLCGHDLGSNPAMRGPPARSAAPVADTGTRAGAGKSTGPSSHLGWWLSGVFMVGLVLIFALPILNPDPDAVWPPPAPAASGGGAAPDISRMTPREAADRLYNRVMTAAESGYTQEVRDFLPMAIAAHDRARPLDLDGLFHLALLHQTGGDQPAALAVAREAMAVDPDHLLGLAAAAESALALGDEEAAREYAVRLLEAYDREMEKGLEEYEAHAVTIDAARERARGLLGR